MQQDITSAQKSFLNHYASHSYEVNQSYNTTAQKKITSSIEKEKNKQMQYKLNNLPIIYDQNNKPGTPIRYPGNSRLIYASGQKETSEKIISSPAVKYETNQTLNFNSKVDTYQVQKPSEYKEVKYVAGGSTMLYSHVINSLGYYNSEPIQYSTGVPLSSLGYHTNTGISNGHSRTIIAQSKPVQQNTDSNFSMPKAEKSGSRLLIDRNNSTTNYIPGRSVTSYVASQVQQEPITQIPTLGKISATTNYSQYTNTNIKSTNPSIIKSEYSSIPAQSVPTWNNPSTVFVNQIPTNISVSTSSKALHTGVSHLSMQTVPKVNYDRCVNQCKNWQTKFNELYLKYMNLAASTIEPNSAQLEQLRQENFILKRQLQEQQQRRIQMAPLLQSKFNEIVYNQKEATIRQCMLLIERYRLQSKQKY